MFVKIESLYRKTLNIDFEGLFIGLKELGFSIGDRELIISTYPMSQKMRGAPRLLFGNGCF